VTDAARLLHVRSELGYTDRPSRALPLEPEAVSAAEQRRLSLDARFRAEEREREAWARCLGIIRGALEDARRELDRGLAAELRGLERQLERIDGMVRRR
jgi:hypothetical protein